MKVLFVMRSVSHFSYHETTVRQLCDRGHSVNVVFDRGWSKDYTDRAARACANEYRNLTLGWSLRRRGLWRRPLFITRELLSYSSYLSRRDQEPFYVHRWSEYVRMGTPWIGYRVRSRKFRWTLRRAPARLALRAFERIVPADGAIKNWLRKNRPDVVVASPTNLRYSEEVEYIKAAKSLGIPTVVPVLSWDNLSTKGLFHIAPDLTMVWNQTQVQEASSIHGLARHRIVVIGSPFMDKWFQESTATLSEAEFRSRAGLDPSRPYVLYLGSSHNIAGAEAWLVEKLAKSLRSSPDKRLRDSAILARPHGANEQSYKDISDIGIVTWIRGRDELPDSPQSFAEFGASLRYATCVVGVNTTGMVDALLADRPVITLLVEEYQNTNAARAVHFRRILDADVYLRAETTDECAQLIADIIDGHDPKRENRRRFVLKYIRPRGLDVPAGAIAARAIEMAGKGKTVAQIDQQIAAEASKPGVLVG